MSLSGQNDPPPVSSDELLFQMDDDNKHASIESSSTAEEESELPNDTADVIWQDTKNNCHRREENGTEIEYEKIAIPGRRRLCKLAVREPFTLSHPQFNFSLSDKIASKLYPHQRAGLEWLWTLHCKVKGGGILGDDMGLGKTLQICAFLAGLFQSNLIKRVLVVAPNTLLTHWTEELQLVGLSSETRCYSGTRVKARQDALQYILQGNGVLLTTYGMVVKHVDSLSGDYDKTDEDAVTWDYMILDEGHLIKNPKTERAKSLLAIPCAHRIIITGTPVQNNLKELWALFSFCCAELLGDKKCFKVTYDSAILRGNDKNASDKDKETGVDVAQKLRNCIKPYFLRRLKDEVFRDKDGENTAKLPKKNEIVVWLKLSILQRQLYKAFLNSGSALSASNGSQLNALRTLNKICDHPNLLTKEDHKAVVEGMKLVPNQEDHRALKELEMHIENDADGDFIWKDIDNLSCKISFIASLLDKLLSQDHNVLIFSGALKMLDLIQDTLKDKQYKFLRMDGTTTKDSDRIQIVKDFQNGDKAPIFLLSSGVAGVGLTLTKADRVIIVGPAWNPSVDDQIADRAYRIGQHRDVIVYRLITCGTIEEVTYKKQIYKEGLFKTATEEKIQMPYFSKQDLKEVFCLPKQGFDVSLTQERLYEEHESGYKMDRPLKVHTKFLRSLGIAGISQHDLLYSKSTPVTRVKRYLGNSASSSSRQTYADAAQYAINPKNVVLQRELYRRAP